MKNVKLEFFVGIFIIIGFLSFGWLALQLGEVPWLTKSRSYIIYAEFHNISGVQSGSEIKIAGVVVGTVRDIILNEYDLARAAFLIDNDIRFSVDSIASVRSKGIIGDKFIKITPGGDMELYAPGDTIMDTESSIDLESLISRFAFGQLGDG